jgi:DNA ligase-1
MINLKTSLFKKDSKSKIRYLTISTENDIIVQESGLLNTDSPVIHRKAAKGKNIGKSNETTAVDQAMIEFKSIVASKLKEGYSTSIEEAKTKVIILPMLAKSYKDEKSKIDWNNCYCSAKLDGQRAIGVEGKLISRDGVEIITLDHITKDLIPDYTIDGELYIHGETFQENMKAIKKYREGITEKVKYNLYDIVIDKPYSERYEILKELVKDKPNFSLVEAFKITSEAELLEYHKKFLSEGYEGTMIRWGNSSYELNKRSSSLLKYKDFLDTDAIIIDIIPADQRPEWGVPVLKYADTSLVQDTFKAGLKFSHKDREDLLKNKHLYIGKTANIRFFEYTDSGVPRFPVMIGIHEDR